MTPALATLRRRRLCLTLLALPLLLLRALLPPGYMPVAAADGFIGLCPDAAPTPPGMHMAGHVHHHSAPEQNDSAGSKHGAPCVFAGSATLAGAPSLSWQPDAALLAIGVAQRAFPTLNLPSIRRAQSPRGPPALPFV